MLLLGVWDTHCGHRQAHLWRLRWKLGNGPSGPTGRLELSKEVVRAIFQGCGVYFYTCGHGNSQGIKLNFQSDQCSARVQFQYLFIVGKPKNGNRATGELGESWVCLLEWELWGTDALGVATIVSPCGFAAPSSQKTNWHLMIPKQAVARPAAPSFHLGVRASNVEHAGRGQIFF